MSWERLPDVPVDSIFTGFSNAVMINETEFIIAPEYFEHNNLFLYNIESTKWDKFIPYSNEMALSAHRICLDKETQDLYLFGQGADLHKINLTTMEIATVKDVFDAGGNVSTTFANSEYHVIGGWNNNHHLIWNENKSKFELFHKFNEWINGVQSAGLIYVPRLKSFFLFGGFDKGGEQYFDTIWTYSLQTQQWQTTQTKLPRKMYDFGHLLTNDQKYILLFGGSGSGSETQDEVCIFDTDSMKLTISNINGPSCIYGCRAIATPHHYIHLLFSNSSREHWRIRVKDIVPWYHSELVFGYVRFIWKDLALMDDIFLPNDLIYIIHKYY